MRDLDSGFYAWYGGGEYVAMRCDIQAVIRLESRWGGVVGISENEPQRIGSTDAMRRQGRREREAAPAALVHNSSPTFLFQCNNQSPTKMCS